MFWPQSDESRTSNVSCTAAKSRNIFQSYVDSCCKNILSNLNSESERIASTWQNMLKVVITRMDTAQSFVDQSQTTLQQITEGSRGFLFSSRRPMECCGCCS